MIVITLCVFYLVRNSAPGPSPRPPPSNNKIEGNIFSHFRLKHVELRIFVFQMRHLFTSKHKHVAASQITRKRTVSQTNKRKKCQRRVMGIRSRRPKVFVSHQALCPRHMICVYIYSHMHVECASFDTGHSNTSYLVT